MSNDWTNKLRERLTDFQEPVKDDLWDAIQQSLAQKMQENEIVEADASPAASSSADSSHARTIKLRRLSMAAAIAALAIGGTYVYLHPWDEVAPSEVASVLSSHSLDSSANSKVADSNGNQTTESSESREQTESGRSTSLLKRWVEKKKADLLALSPANNSKELLSLASENETSSIEKQETEKLLGNCSRMTESAKVLTETEESKTQKATSTMDKQTSAPSRQRENAQPMLKKESVQQKKQPVGYELATTSYEAIPSRHSKKSSWNMKFYGENGFAQNNKGGSQPLLASDSPLHDSNEGVYYGQTYGANDAFDLNAFKNVGNMEYREKVEHHLPISAGVQVGYALTDRLQITTGLVYTYTSSDFIGSTSGSQVVTTQKLHYLGIPVNLSYDLWGTTGFRTYVTIGGEGAVNIKNQTESDGVETESKKDRMQWSANAAVGAQYNFIPQLGIYVEPGAKYYFDNGSKIENTFKDKKLNFNLQLGLRWNIK